MTTPTWPATLPQLFDQRTMDIGPMAHSVVEFGTEVGPGMRRVRSSRAEDRYNVTFRMTDAQKTAFETFFYGAVNRVKPFLYPDPTTGTTRRFRFAAESPFSLRRVGTEWDVACRWLRRR